jgi:NADPH:quinone reductase-like Zn-dependent oxidoreductase
MKALRLLEYGGQLVFGDVPTPAIARDEILVKIKSTAVNLMGCRPLGRERQDAGHTARSSFVWPGLAS